VFGWDCQYCQQEIPELIKLKDKFVNAFDTIAIEAQHYSNEYNLERINRYNINYSIVEGDRQKSFLQYLKDEYKWDGVIPLTIVINSTGRVLAFEVGYKSYSLTTLLQTTLKQLTRVVSSSK
jgi:thiol-disulfide isomerase/thioredoxin